jgi:hypothetical protein
MWEKRNPHTLLVRIQPLWKIIWRLLKNLNIDLPYDPAIPLPGIYPKNATQATSKAPAQHPSYGNNQDAPHNNYIY